MKPAFPCCEACKQPLAPNPFKCECGLQFCISPTINEYYDHDRRETKRQVFHCYELHHCTLGLEKAIKVMEGVGRG